MSKAQSQLSLEFTTPWDTEVEVVCWVQDFRFGTEGGESYSCDFWASNITASGFTANATASKNAERLTVNWIVYKKDKSKVASGSFGTEDIEDREEETPENSGRVDFAEGAFDTTPTVLAALSQFDLEGGKDLRVAVEIEDISTSGFTWHLSEFSLSFARSTLRLTICRYMGRGLYPRSPQRRSFLCCAWLCVSTAENKATTSTSMLRPRSTCLAGKARPRLSHLLCAICSQSSCPAWRARWSPCVCRMVRDRSLVRTC